MKAIKPSVGVRLLMRGDRQAARVWRRMVDRKAGNQTLAENEAIRTAAATPMSTATREAERPLPTRLLQPIVARRFANRPIMVLTRAQALACADMEGVRLVAPELWETAGGELFTFHAGP